MKRAIKILREPRQFLLNLVSELTTEQLNKVPKGFNNNIIWNLGHMVAAQQNLCYKLAGVDIRVSDVFFETYKSDTKPEKYIGADEITTVKEQLLTTLDQFDIDLEKGIFSNFTPKATRYGVELQNIDDAVAFLPFHDGFHIGYVMALKRVIQ